jgi:hypothetical protein
MENEDLIDLRILVARLETVIEQLDKRVKGLVTQEEFRPVKLIAYGIAGTVLLAASSAVARLVIF